MSNLFILVNRNYADRNSLADLCAAISEMGATIVSVDEQSHLIEALTPAAEIPTIAAMEGVCYVRSSFNYLADHGGRSAA